MRKASDPKTWFKKGNSIWKNRLPDSIETRNKKSLSHRGMKFSLERNRKISLSNTGKKRTPEQKKNLKWPLERRIAFSKAQMGKNNPSYKDGRKTLNKRIRHSLEYKLWRTAVFTRDNYTCVWCAQKGGRLEADHIKPFALFPELRFSIDNGRTLCYRCHKSITFKN